MASSNSFAATILKGVFGSKKGADAPATLYIALSSTAPTVTDGTIGNVTEPAAGGYQRLAVTNNDANWSVVGRVASNVLQLEFSTATDSWGAQVGHAVLFDAASGGSAFTSCALGAATTVNAGTRVVLPAGALTVTIPTS